MQDNVAPFASLFPKREAIVQGDPDVHIRVRCPSLPHDESKTLPSRIRFTAGLALLTGPSSLFLFALWRSNNNRLRANFPFLKLSVLRSSIFYIPLHIPQS